MKTMMHLMTGFLLAAVFLPGCARIETTAHYVAETVVAAQPTVNGAATAEAVAQEVVASGQVNIEQTAQPVVQTAIAAQPTPDIQEIIAGAVQAALSAQQAGIQATAQAAAETVVAAQPTVDVQGTAQVVVGTAIAAQAMVHVTATPTSTVTASHAAASSIATTSPTPTTSPARCEGPTFICSPHGSIPPDTKACSPDWTQYAKGIDQNGTIRIYDLNDQPIRDVTLPTHTCSPCPNDLKGLAWSPDGQWLAGVFHHDAGGHIALINLVTGEREWYDINDYYHCIKFSPDGTQLVADPEGQVVATRRK